MVKKILQKRLFLHKRISSQTQWKQETDILLQPNLNPHCSKPPLKCKKTAVIRGSYQENVVEKGVSG